MKKLRKWLEDRNINYKKYLILFYIIFIMAPVLIVLSLNDTGENVFARTMASVLLLVFFVVFFIYDYRKKLADDWGLRSVEVEENPYKYASKALVGAKNVKVSASFDLEEIYELISGNMPKSGCHFEILLLNPYCDYAKLCDETEKYAEHADKFEALASQSQNEIDIKYYSLMPVNNLFIINENVYVYPMTHKLSDGRRIFRYYRGKKAAYKNYCGYFKRTWENPLYEPRNGGHDNEEEK